MKISFSAYKNKKAFWMNQVSKKAKRMNKKKNTSKF